ncbi:DNA-binding transcriptional regulator, GntR family [Paracoccus isoporae]|uniref:DNA-binding transcriptional regulator, GntR family n=1 Tax=Paracoccus isoporae TaxID=591205 RepID=A0A1G6TQK4_9RHOB|nr:GntR family transcriptional regulator [Paracoccus isoporae]SDD30605.1 DNA-binding transcriptional regulator, GntR family [Paracoccus isoporae]
MQQIDHRAEYADPDGPGADGLDHPAQPQAGDRTAAAYERIEELFVSLQLQPGAALRTQDLQALTGLGRTPVHQAVRRLAAETLLDVQPRNGVRVAPIDLARERRLADLRRDMERFICGAAIAGMEGNERARLFYIKDQLRADADRITLDRFNMLDKAFDMLMIQASRERFLERSLRPLKALGRRAGYLDISRVSGAAGLRETVERHLAIMEAVLDRDVARARDMSDGLINFGLEMLDRLERHIDPACLDISFGLETGQGGRAG